MTLRESATFDRPTIAAIQRAAETGVYDIRGWGAKRSVPHFDDLLFLGRASRATRWRAIGSAAARTSCWAGGMPPPRCTWTSR